MCRFLFTNGRVPESFAVFSEVDRNCEFLINIDTLRKSIKIIYASMYNNLGALYDGIDSIQKALLSYKNALKYAAEINDSSGWSLVLEISE